MTSTKSLILAQLEGLRLLINQLPEGDIAIPIEVAPKPPTFQPATANHAEAYGVTVTQASATPGGCWRAVLVRHLAPVENKGRHGVYVDVIDANGKRVENSKLRLCYSWEGRNQSELAPPRPFDKRGDTGHGMIDIYKGQKLSVWIGGDGLPSDVVQGIHSNHPDEPGPNGETWNSVGHHSFYIKFQVVTQ